MDLSIHWDSLLHRNDNLFRDLDSRALTAAEEDIIAKRVALQRRMLEEYERRERARKVPHSQFYILYSQASKFTSSCPPVSQISLKPLTDTRE